MGVKNISAIELTEILKREKLPIIDIRPTGEYNLGHIPGSINIVLGDLLRSPEQYINPNKRYYIICEEGKKVSVYVMSLDVWVMMLLMF